MNKVTSTDIQRAALIAGVGVAAWVVERLGERSDIPVAIFLVGFVGWMVFQIVRNRKHPPDPLRVKYGRLALAGIAMMLVLRTIVERVGQLRRRAGLRHGVPDRVVHRRGLPLPEGAGAEVT